MAAMTSSAAALRWHSLHTLQRPGCLPRVSCCFGKNLGRRHGERIASCAELSRRRRSGAVVSSAADEPSSSASHEIREESLSNLKLCTDEKRIISVSSLRGAARLMICAGPASFITEAFKLSEPYTNDLLERGVLIVPFPSDGNTPSFKFYEREEMKYLTSRRRRLWQLTPVYATEWSRWLEEQKKLSGISVNSPVYLSLRMDGHVRGSGVGYPPWNAFVAQLPPVKGMWLGLLDSMDGKVL